MASTRALSDDDGAELLGAAAALRWSRPDLSAALADHVLEVATADALDGSWLRAAGWAVHARSATGDGRDCASDILGGLVERGTHLLDHPAADLLRVELAVLAAGAGRAAAARTLLTPVTVADTTPELRADALCALARCAMQDRPSSVLGLISRVEATWVEVGGRRGDVGAAVASLVAASAERRAGRSSAAIDRAAMGLACLDRARGARSESPAPHIAAGLTAEWISGLLEAGRAEDAREVCAPLETELRESARPSRQLALLRLTVARAVTTTDTDAAAAALERAARDAAESDAPDLEYLCWSTLAALQEKSGHRDSALESLKLGLDAQQRDTRRGSRFRAALDAVVPPSYEDAGGQGGSEVLVSGVRNGQNGSNGRRARNGVETGPGSAITGLLGPAEDAATSSGGAWTDWSTAVQRDRPSDPAPTSGPGQHLADPHRDAPRNGTGGGRRRAAADQWDDADAQGPPEKGLNGDGPLHGAPAPVSEPIGAGDPWLGWTDESPIGRFLAESRRGADELEQQDRVPDHRPEPVLPVVEPDPQPGRAANPWSTGSWSAQGWGRPEPSAGWLPSDTGPRTAGSETAGSETAGSETAGSETAGSETAASETAGSESAGSQSAGSRTAGSQSAGSQSAGSQSAGSQSAGPHTAGSGGRRRRADPDDTAALTLPPDPLLDAPAAPTEPESGTWLADAMAELDRALSGPPRAAPEAEGCVVVIDLARDGRRFAGRRAGAVVRAVADQMTGRLPSGARVRHDDADALSVVLPGWNRSAATEWMHGTLPDVFDNVVSEDLPGTRLRAAVHDIDGPVGAQLLQRLDAGVERGTAPQWDGPDGRHGTTDRAPFHVEHPGPASAGGGGRRRRNDDAAVPVAAEPEAAASTDGLGTCHDLESTEGLGLADLLAGALAAYRSI